MIVPTELTEFHEGEVRDVLARLPAGSVQSVVTSPPYWSLRDYGLPPVAWEDGAFCPLGLEESVDSYVAHIVEVFAAVHRVLRDDGVCWVNIGDSYAGSTQSGGSQSGRCDGGTRQLDRQRDANRTMRTAPTGIPAKNLLMMPHRCAIALQDWGWIVRNDLVWAKLNPLPESVTDRATRAHEFVFQLVKQPRYYYDAMAVREPAEYGRRDWNGQTSHTIYDAAGKGQRLGYTTTGGDPSIGRNLRSVLTLATEPFSQAHFATFPTKLVEPLLRASTSEAGACPRCGAPWKREVQTGDPERIGGNSGVSVAHATGPMDRNGHGQSDEGHMPKVRPRNTLGWHPSCPCNAGPPQPCAVLDPFAGSGTTGVVASKLGLRSILIDQNPAYLQMAKDRIAAQPTRLFAVTASVKKSKRQPSPPPAAPPEGRYVCPATLPLPEVDP